MNNTVTRNQQPLNFLSRRHPSILRRLWVMMPHVVPAAGNAFRALFILPSLLIPITLLLLSACNSGSGSITYSAAAPSITISGHPYLRNSPYAAVLSECVASTGRLISGPCTLGKLSLVGMTTGGNAASVEQIMQRVFVSDDWMGEVFENFLLTQDSSGDFKQMLNAVTAVVIARTIRPSMYRTETGAIYLDPDSLWLTPEQRDTVDTTPDFRSGFGAALNYEMPARYVLNDQYAFVYPDIEERQSRTLTDLRYSLGRVLYHELAHAADFLPPAMHAALNPNQTVAQAIPNVMPSLALDQRFPLASQEMAGLAKVRFFGVKATQQQIAYTPNNVASFFSDDGANDDYNYSNHFEDTAMLVEEAMMLIRHGVQRDIAVTNTLTAEQTSDDLIVTWGQRGRIGELAIKPRVKFVLAQIMPWVDASLVDNLPAPQQMHTGLSWDENLDLSNRARPFAVQPSGPSGARRVHISRTMLERDLRKL